MPNFLGIFFHILGEIFFYIYKDRHLSYSSGKKYELIFSGRGAFFGGGEGIPTFLSTGPS